MSNAKGKKTQPGEESRQAEQSIVRRRNRGNPAVELADWGSVEPSLLLGVVSCITRWGFAVQFGYTRDGGAYVVRVVGDGEPFNEYVRPTEDIDLYLRGLLEDYK